MEEDGRGRRDWLCALGAEHVETTMAQKRAQEEGADGAGRGPQVMMVEAGYSFVGHLLYGWRRSEEL